MAEGLDHAKEILDRIFLQLRDSESPIPVKHQSGIYIKTRLELLRNLEKSKSLILTMQGEEFKYAVAVQRNGKA